MTIKELQAKRTQLYNQITTVAKSFKANGDKFASDAAKQEWEAANAEYDQVSEALSVDRRMHEFNEPVNPRGIGFDDAGDGMVGGRSAPGNDPADEWKQLFRDRDAAGRPEYVVNQRGEEQLVLRRRDSMAAELAKARPELVEAAQGVELGSYLRSLVVGGKTAAERNALSSSGVSAGGVTVPVLLAAQLIDTMRAKSRVLQAGAATIRMDEGEVMYAKLTGDGSAAWRAESQEITESQPTFGGIRFTAKNLARLVKVPRELLEDSVNIQAKLPEVLARSMADELDRAAMFGLGAALEPMGVFNMSGVNSVSMGANGAALTSYSQLLDAIEAIETDNAEAPTAAIMHPRTARVYAGLADTTEQPLQRPDALKNVSFLTTTKVPIDQVQGGATNASSILLGGWSELVIAMRSQVTLQILNERYGEFNQVGFLVTLRADVGAWHEEAFAKIIGIIPA
jgi:HK97 family phage major capsid protein